jgi:5-methyltetrahydrofolate--homocysteine methyltransferase
MLGLISAMKPHAAVPLVAKPNAGLPTLVGDATVFDLDAAGFAGFAGALAAAGVNLMGGCCGTTPAHIRALRDALVAVKPVAPHRHPPAAASSARNALFLEEGRALAIAGSRLNAAENEAVRQGLLNDDVGPARQTARAQEKEGAQILLLKGGAAGLDEAEITRQILEALAPTTRSSFLIDAERVKTVGSALRFYPGRPLVRISRSAAAFLPVIAKYGAIPVIPCPADGNKGEIRRAVAEAKGYGFRKEEIVIDCTPVEQHPEALRAAPGMISLCTQLGCRTLLDLTEAGKGLPDQRWLQAHLLAAAHAAGLTIAVADPAVAELMQIRAAGDRLRAGG